MTESNSTNDIPRHENLVNEQLVTWHFVMALVFLGASLLGGLIYSLQLVNWNPHQGIEYLSPGRWPSWIRLR